MEDKHTINEICLMLGAIKEQNNAGFQGIHDRQDKPMVMLKIILSFDYKQLVL